MKAFKRSHLRLLVTAFEACFVFYRDILELPVRYGDRNGPYAEFKSSALHLALFDRLQMARVLNRAQRPPEACMQDRSVLVLRVDGVEPVAEALVAKGVRLATPPTDRPEWGCRTAHLYDPDGNLIEINADL